MYIIQFISMFLPGKYKPILEMKCGSPSSLGPDYVQCCYSLLFLKSSKSHGAEGLRSMDICRICDPGLRNFTIERSGAQLTSTMHREISPGSLRGPEIDRHPPPPILYFNH